MQLVQDLVPSGLLGQMIDGLAGGFLSGSHTTIRYCLHFNLSRILPACRSTIWLGLGGYHVRPALIHGDLCTLDNAFEPGISHGAQFDDINGPFQYAFKLSFEVEILTHSAADLVRRKFDDYVDIAICSIEIVSQ